VEEKTMNDPCDFPAAHSMDTTWFAVDRDGHVAAFETGEAGAVPTTAYVGEEDYAILDEVREGQATGAAVFDLEGWKLRDSSDHVKPAPGLTPGRLLIFVRSREDLDPSLGEVREVPATTGAAAIAEQVSDAALDALHARGACLGCFGYYVDAESPANPAEFGLFHYEHATDNEMAGPYALVRRPQRPLSIDAVPASLKEKAVVFDGRFAETLWFQPAELWKCESWNDAWIGTDMKTVHPFPGREKEFAAEREQFEPSEDYVFVDVAESKPEARRVVEGDPEPTSSSAPPAASATKPWWKFW
jgi:hypothetical protein